MRKKIPFIFLFVVAFTFFGTLGYFNFQRAYATGPTASVWDGTYVTDVNDLTDDDLYYVREGAKYKYYVRSAKGLSYVANLINSTDSNGGYRQFKGYEIWLETDIDLNYKAWKPIGAMVATGNYFDGLFYGQGHYIYNLSLDTSYSELGFFGRLGSNSVVSNLHMRGFSGNSLRSNDKIIGGIAGRLEGDGSKVQILECSVKGSINFSSLEYNSAGGIVGYVNNGSIKNCRSEVLLDNSGNTGGIVGYANNVSISECYFVANNISGASGSIGGLVGRGVDLNITDCYVSADLNCKGSAYYGGLIGTIDNENTSTNIITSYYIGDMYTSNATSSAKYAGFIGFVNDQGWGITSKSVTISNSFYRYDYADYATTIITSPNYPNSVKFSNVYSSYASETRAVYLADLSNLSVTSLFYSNTKYWSSSTTWNFLSTWNISSGLNKGLPYLRNTQNIGNANNDEDYTSYNGLSGYGTEENPYMIYTAGDLAFLSYNYSLSIYSGKYFALANDIDLSGKNWKPIGSSNAPFKGVFDGNNFNIYGMTCSFQQAYDFHGLFGVASDAVIKNLTVEQSIFINEGVGNSSLKGYTGTILGMAQNNVYIINCNSLLNKDLNGGTISPVGFVADNSNLYVIYGVKNCDINWNIDDTKFDIDLITKSNSASIITGYDITIDSKIGTFRNSRHKTYSGIYHILINESGSVILPNSKVGQTIDNNYGKTFLPGLSKVSGEDYWKCVGYQLTGYSYVSDDSTATTVNSSSGKCTITSLNMAKKPIQGLYVNYITKTVTVKIIYNYTAVRDGSNIIDLTRYNNSDLKIDSNGYVYSEFICDYDSNLLDNPLTDDVPTYLKDGKTTMLRDGDFNMNTDSLYSTSGSYLGISNPILTGDVTYTRSWNGRTDKVYSIKVNLKKEDGTDIGDFELQDVVEKVSLGEYPVVFNNTVTIQWTDVTTLVNDSAIFTYNTTDYNQIFGIKVSLKDGYSLVNELSANDLKSNYNRDTNFGTLVCETVLGNSSNFFEEGSLYFKNLLGDYTIDLTVTKTKHEDLKVIIGDDTLFGVAPVVEDFQKVKVWVGNQFNESLTNTFSNALAYDFFNNKLLSKSDKFDAIDLLSNSLIDGKMIFRYELTDNQSQDYLYEISGDNMALYSINFDEQSQTISNKILIVALTKMDTHFDVQYYTGANFEFVFSTESDIVAFNTISPNQNEVGDIVQIAMDIDGDPTKVAMTFENLNGLYDNNNQEITEIKAIPTYTVASFTFQAVNEQFIPIELNAPKLDGQLINVLSDGTFFIDIPSTYYYAFKGLRTSGMAAFDSNIKIIASNSNTDIVGYESSFNNNNGNYLNIISADFYAKGSVNGKETFNEDTYRIKFSYNASSNLTTGLQPGAYLLQFVCEPIYYSINLKTEVVKNGSTVIDEPHDIETQVWVNGETYTNLASTILYDDEISLQTNLTQIQGYEFVGWRFESPCKSMVSSDQNEVTAIYSQLNNMDEVISGLSSNIYNSRFTLNITAIYNSLDSKINLTENAQVRDVNGSGEIEEINCLSLGITLHNANELYDLNIVDNSLNYAFSLAEDDRELLDKLYFAKTNVGYYFVGYKFEFSTGESEEILFDKQVDNMNLNQVYLNLFDSIQNYVRQNGVAQVTLTPILKQKTATIIFSSGTGGEGNEFGDQKNGRVYNNLKSDTTNLTLTLEKVYFQNTVYLYNVNNLTEMEGTFNLNDVFYSRDGYQKPDLEFWHYKILGTDISGKLPAGELNLNANYFANDDILNKSVHLYVFWTPQTFYVGLGVEDGFEAEFDEEYSSAQQSKVAQVSQVTTKTGYYLVGWGLEDHMIFDTAGNLIDEQELIYKNNIFRHAGDVYLSAIWERNTYNVTLEINSANEVKIKDKIIDTAQSIMFEIGYEATLDSLYYNEEYISINDISATRSNYIFAGIYAIAGEKKLKITDDMMFSQDLLGVNLNADSNLTLYICWQFDVNSLGLSFTSAVFEEKVYNGSAQTYYISAMFGENADLTGFITVGNEDNFIITMPEKANSLVNAQVSINTTNAEVDGLAFSVTNADNYIITLAIEVFDNASYLNLGRVYYQNNYFYLTIKKATLNLEMENMFTDNSKLLNLKRIITPFEDSQNALFMANSLTDFADIVKQKDTSATEATNQEMYEYFMVKYYMMLHSNNANYKIYKEWNFEDYQLYKIDNLLLCDNIINQTYLFDFYNFEAITFFSDVTNSYQIDGKAPFKILFGNSEVEDVEIYKITLNNNVALQANQNVVTRFYLTGNISNFELEFQQDEVYIELNTGYIMPQILTLPETAKQESQYFNQNISAVEVSWQDGYAQTEINEQIFYQVDNTDLYIQAQILTSNNGNKDIDTSFSWADTTNYLYLDNVIVYLKQTIDEETVYEDVTANFKIVVNFDHSMTILSTKGVAKINLAAKYYTINNNGFAREDISDSLAMGLLKIVEVNYQIDGQDFEVYNNSNALEEGVYQANGLGIYEILKGEANEVSLMVSSLVTNVKFALNSTVINDYIAFQKWTLESKDSLMDTLEKETFFEIQFNFSEEQIVATTSSSETVSGNADSLFEVNAFAIFTDLVKIKYNLNLPSSVIASTTSETVLKLGYSTVDQLYLPSQTSLEIDQLTIMGSGKDYTEMFDVNGYFVGADATNKHNAVTLNVVWKMEELDFIQLFEEYNAQVKTFTGFDYTDIVAIYNMNERFFSYNFTWEKQQNELWQQISTTQSFILEKNGTFDESGSYRLIVTADLGGTQVSKAEFITAGTFGDNSTVAKMATLNFDLNFYRTKISNLSFNILETASSTYNGRDHIYDWTISFESANYDPNINGYGESVVQSYNYIENGDFFTSIFLDGSRVNEMVNANTYQILANFNEDVFDISDLNQYQFEYTVSALDYDISAETFEFEKQFNAEDVVLSKQIYLASQTITLVFSREAGEDVGDYDLYFATTEQTPKHNINYYYNDTLLFENGQLTQAGQTFVVGKFSIVPSGLLTLSYEVTENTPKVIEAEFDANGYSLHLTDDLKLQILKNNVLYKELSLKLFDSTQNKTIEDTTILSYLQTELAQMNLQFFTTFLTDNAVNAGTYTYRFDSNPATYYNSIEFDSSFALKILGDDIDVSQFTFNKVFDNNNMMFVNLDGEVIEDISTYSGVYISAEFATVHAGENIRVNLNLTQRESDINLSNYALSSLYAFGNIAKKNATMTISLSKDEYVYGEVSNYSLKNLINYQIVDENLQVVENNIIQGYYTLDLSAENAQFNTRGYIYAGSYALTANASFVDFNMTINCPTIKIVPRVVQYSLPENYITIEVGDIVEDSYLRSLDIYETGDKIDLEYVVENYTGQPLSTGKYNLVLKDNKVSYLINDSIQLDFDGTNAFAVLISNETLFVNLEDTSILSQIYNKKSYVFSTDINTQTLTITNGENSWQTKFTFYVEDAEIPFEETGLTSLDIAPMGANPTIVSKYLMLVEGDSTNYYNIAFKNEIIFEINKIIINAENLILSKEYDNSREFIIDDFTEKLVDDDVEILAIFDNKAVGTNKSGQFYLQGADSYNYSIVEDFDNGTISKANAILTLSKTSYVYGEFNKFDTLQFEVLTSEKIVTADEYNIAFTIEDATYSEANYLQVGQYNVTLTTNISGNYNISFTEQFLSITPYQWNISLNINGGYETMFGSLESYSNTFEAEMVSPLYESLAVIFTREEGQDLGYYKVLNASLKDNVNYQIVKVEDISSLGYFRIVKANDYIYFLYSDADTIAGTTTVQDLPLAFEYDGNNYDVADIVYEGGAYYLRFYSSQNANEKKFLLNTYRYDDVEQVYNKTTEIVNDLKANISILQSEVKNVGAYYLQSSDVSATNYEVFLGLRGETYRYCLNITPRQLYFKEEADVISKVFDNQNAEFFYNDASVVLERVIEGDLINLQIQVMQDASSDIIAKYVGENYDIKAIIGGEGSENYHLNNITSQSSKTVTGAIERAELTLVVDSEAYTYGDLNYDEIEGKFNIDFDFSYQTEVDLQGYTRDLGIEIHLNFDQDQHLSTSGHLKAGQYNFTYVFRGADFNLTKFICDKQEYNRTQIQNAILPATITISPKTVTIAPKADGKSLQEIFTKTYDDTTAVTITDENGLLFDCIGFIESDDVNLASANYAIKTVGNAIQIDFALAGAEATDYLITPYLTGVINAITIKIKYNLDGGKMDVADDTLLKSIAFPFVSTSSLTANSTDVKTSSSSSFPTAPTKTGFGFTHWTLNIDAVTANTNQYNYLEQLTAKYNVAKEFAGYTYKITIDNGERSIKLLAELIGNDTNNLIGYYYKANNDIQITLTANYETNKYTVRISLTDEQGNIANLGQAVINDSGSAITRNPYSVQVSHGDSLKIEFTPNQYCLFNSVYINNSSTGWDSGIIIANPVLFFTSITKSYDVQIRFEKQKAKITLNVSDFDGIKIKSQDFVKQFDGNYIWNTERESLDSIMLSKVASEIYLPGYELSKLNEVLKTNFTATSIGSLFKNTQDKEVSLLLTPTFEAVGIGVTLDYGYDNKIVELIINFNSKYADATNWEEIPVRTGYGFLGWYNEAGEKVVGDMVVTNEQPHTLTANWQIKSHNIQFTVDKAQITSSSPQFAFSNDVYTAENIEFGSEVSFTIFADTGYEIPAIWDNSLFDVKVNDDGSAIVTFDMPDEDVIYTIEAVASKNTITIAGENLAEFKAFVDDQEVAIENNAFQVTTGDIVRVEAKSTLGFSLTKNITFSVDTVQAKDISLQNGVLSFNIVGVDQDLSVTLFTEVIINKLSFVFDNYSAFNWIYLNGVTYTELEDLNAFDVASNTVLEMYVEMKHGFMLENAESEQFDVGLAESTDAGFIGSFKITVTNILMDGSISFVSSKAKFSVEIKVVSFDTNKNEVEIAGNKAFVNNTTTVSVDYQDTVTLTQEAENLYSFVGWGYDKNNIFDSSSVLEYEVLDNVVIYAIFTTLKYEVSLKTYNYYTVFDEQGENEQEFYNEIVAYFYFGQDRIDKFDIYYGTEKTIIFNLPQGYTYSGYGYFDGDTFVYLDRKSSEQQQLEVPIYSMLLPEDTPQIDLCFIVVAKQANILFESYIDYDGILEDNKDVGSIELQDETGAGVNQLGYINGTRIHYSSESFENGTLKSDQQFEVIAYTGEEIYLKIQVQKVGYKFLKIEATNILATMVTQNKEYAVYKFTNFIGETENICVKVLFKPDINIVNLTFDQFGVTLKAGSFTVDVGAENLNKVWTSGQEYSGLQVSAYTDTSFEVNAYIRAGYYLEDVQIIDSSNLILPESIIFTELSLQNTGFIGKITFKVSGYLGVHDIKVAVRTSLYTVVLKEDSKELAKIKNVSFNSLLNLNENNTNIEILDERIEFLGGMLNVVINKENYTFEGFFTYQNGVGNRYIDANGDAINYWKETGYEFDIKTNSYILQDNVYIDPETNQIVIPIYIYWSYLKTRINFEMIPSISTNYTAQDIVSGVDWYNSWYYSTSPNYIEVSFNTDIRITAPEVEGYAFFKYVISQKNSSGVWLTDVVAYTEQIPWSTNEYDRIVECRIKIIYFAQVEVKIFGGEGGFEIIQDYTETQAKSMLENGYVDTTKPYALEAKPSEGYQFVRWTNSSTGKHTYSTKIENLTTTKKANFLLTLKGIKATLSFEEYDATFGQITQLIIVSKDNNYQTLTVGTFVGDDFNKILKTVDVAVGDKITLIIKINYGFAVVWNRNDITFDSYSGNNVYRFNMNIMPADAGQTIVINPTFEDEILSIYATTKFEDSQIREDALDLNVVNKAGYFQYNGQKTTFFTIANGNDIIVDIVCMARYQIANVILENYKNVFVNNNEIYKQNQIILTKEFMQANNIIGNINIIVEFKRAMWIEQTIVEEFEGDGTKGRPYQISSADQLAKIMNLINTGVKNNEGKLYADCAYQLTADIDLSQYFWTPIGNDDYAFNGSFDFANHNVYGINLAYTCDKIDYNGLFSNVGINGKIFSSNANYWYIYLVVVLFIFMLAILFVLLFVHKKHRKEREKLANK